MKLLFIFMFFILSSHELRAFEDCPSPELGHDLLELVQKFDHKKKETITFTDAITPESINKLIAKIEKVISKNQESGVEITLLLESLGGDVNHTLRAVKFIREMNQNPAVTINTKVMPRKTCESACTILFTAGEKRIAGSKALFGFHAPKIVKGDLGKYTKEEVEDIYRKIWLNSISEVDPYASHFIEANDYLMFSRMRYLAGKELNTGYVTDIL